MKITFIKILQDQAKKRKLLHEAEMQMVKKKTCVF
jgi:hypothetical protein